MKQLYFNPATNVIFGSEDTQDASIRTITTDEVSDLIANGATVDASANDIVPKSDSSAGASTQLTGDAPNAQGLGASAITSGTAGEPGNKQANPSSSQSAPQASLGTDPGNDGAGTDPASRTTGTSGGSTTGTGAANVDDASKTTERKPEVDPDTGKVVLRDDEGNVLPAASDAGTPSAEETASAQAAAAEQAAAKADNSTRAEQREQDVIEADLVEVEHSRVMSLIAVAKAHLASVQEEVVRNALAALSEIESIFHKAKAE